MPSEAERELTPVAADEAADDEYKAHLVGASSSGGSSDLLTLIVAANAMMIWPWLVPWYCWTQLFREPRETVPPPNATKSKRTS
jgi:hypothetical protein